MGIAVEAESISKSFGKIRVLNNISFRVYRREIFAFLGPNGAGKTTLMEILALTLKPDSGRLTILGYDALREDDKIRHYISIIRQQPGFDFFISGMRNLKIFAKLYGTKIDSDWINTLLDIFEMREVLNRPVMQYSGGMMKKLAIIRSLIVQPRILLMDEPTAGLDVKSSEVFWSVISDIRDKGSTIIFATHRIKKAELYANRVAIIHQGKIIALATPDELRNKVPGNYVIRMEIMNYTDDLKEHILGINGVEEVIAIKSVTNRTILRVYCADEGILADLVGRVSHKARLLSVNIREKSLEDVFVFYTGGEFL